MSGRVMEKMLWANKKRCRGKCLGVMKKFNLSELLKCEYRDKIYFRIITTMAVTNLSYSGILAGLRSKPVDKC